MEELSCKFIVALLIFGGSISKSFQNEETNAVDPWSVFADENSDFCYNDSLPCGPSKWGGYCNQGNNGRQSPVDLSSANAIFNFFYRMRMSKTYDKAIFDSFSIQNDGHSIQISLPVNPTSEDLRVSYDFLGLEPYKFSKLHFHWGRNKEYGAEHLRKGNPPFVMEVHLVHYALKYGSIEEAMKATSDPEALTVLGMFVNVCDDSTHTTPFAQIITDVANAGKYPSNDIALVKKQFSLSRFIPKRRSHYSYQGSLTTPECAEIVKWTVFHQPICISKQEIDVFRNIFMKNGEVMDTNHRPLQKLGNRRIAYYS